ncbi:MAG: glycine zipper 2TM domain-containing protein [Alphaproteobacteria bacterium]|nr:glycine zipper 2TM domain-containing protein [Alphaproteobacteria bacterium]
MRNSLFRLLLTAVPLAPASAAVADPPLWAPAHGRQKHHHYDDDEYVPPPPHIHVITYNDVIYRARDGRYYCHRSDGTRGLVVGAAVGGLIGNRLARGQSETLGTLLGAGAGAVIGQQMGRGSLHCE